MADDQQIVLNEKSPARVSATIQSSRVFISWLASLGAGAEVVEPAHIRAEVAAFLKTAAERYSEDA